MQCKLLFAIMAVSLIVVPTASSAQSCTDEQAVACERLGTNNLCKVYSCVPQKPRWRGDRNYRCVLGNKLDGSLCSAVGACIPYGTCSSGTCAGPTLACSPQTSQPPTTTCMCSNFKCSALNRQTGKSLNASHVCTAQPVPSKVWLPE
jgi:hypothetical protein